MKKSVNVFLVFAMVLLMIGVLSVGSVWAGGMSSSYKNKCKLITGYNYLFDPVECYCLKESSDNFQVKPLRLEWSRSNWNEGFLFNSEDDRADDGSSYYCYVTDPQVEKPSVINKPGSASWGTGEVRMCTEDEYADYYSASTGVVSSNGREGNKECDLGIPFCKDKKCHECLEDEDCSAKIYAPKDSTANCIFAKYYDKNKLCTYCQHISGSGDYKVTFVVDAYIENYSEFVNSLVSVEPLKYLNLKNQFTFQVVDTGNLHAFFYPEYDYYLHPAGNYQTSMLTTESGEELVDFSKNVCGESDLTVFIDSNYPQDTREQGGATIVLTGQPGYATNSIFYNFIHMAYYGDYNDFIWALHHEFGHAMGDLGDEYRKTRAKRDYIERVNLQKPDTSVSNSADQCTKFTSYDVLKPNCFEISGKDNQGNLRIEGNIRKSTSDSLMASNKEQFNAISCAGILNKILGTEIKQGVKYCTGQEFAPDNYGNKNYNIGNGIMPQG
jgi:hypothetical protein